MLASRLPQENRGVAAGVKSGSAGTLAGTAMPLAVGEG